MNLTPEQALADVKAVRRDRADSHWLDCAIVLADQLNKVEPLFEGANEDRKTYYIQAEAYKREAGCLRPEIGKLRAELEKMAAHLDERTIERDSARIDAANVAGPLLDSIAKLHADNVSLKEADSAIGVARAEFDKIRAERDILAETLKLLRAALDKSESRLWELEKDTREKERVIAALCANLDAIKTEPDANPAPALSRFLPVRPADVPATPEGWVYAGPGRATNKDKDSSKSIINVSSNNGSNWVQNWMVRGYNEESHYAIRWTAEPDIWHRFGLLAPSEGGGWIPHTPGDPMPCEGEMIIDVLIKSSGEETVELGSRKNETTQAKYYIFSSCTEIIGWRPALAEVAT